MGVGRNRVNGLLRGAVGGLAGLLAMRLFMKAAGALGAGSDDGDGEGPIEGIEALDDIAVGETRTREDEPSTETMGRLAHEAVMGEEPADDRRAALGQAVHWGYGVLMGGLYGASRPEAGVPDVKAGLGWGTALWVIGDELVVPMLGLAEGPTAHPWSDHAKALGAHLAYGAATATATQALRHVM